MDNPQLEAIQNQAKDDFTLLRSEAKDVVDRVRLLGQDAQQSIGKNTMDAFTVFARETHDTVEFLEQYIKQKPLRSTLISFGLGLCIARVIGSWTCR